MRRPCPMRSSGYRRSTSLLPACIAGPRALNQGCWRRKVAGEGLVLPTLRFDAPRATAFMPLASLRETQIKRKRTTYIFKNSYASYNRCRLQRRKSSPRRFAGGAAKERVMSRAPSMLCLHWFRCFQKSSLRLTGTAAAWKPRSAPGPAFRIPAPADVARSSGR